VGSTGLQFRGLIFRVSRGVSRCDRVGGHRSCFGYSDTWQLVINTGTTIVTFLIVFLIQHAQNHDARAVHLKLDELLQAIKAARTGLVDLEERSEAELARLKEEFLGEHRPEHESS
jgi:low affinity Fe/Cu permease